MSEGTESKPACGTMTAPVFTQVSWCCAAMFSVQPLSPVISAYEVPSFAQASTNNDPYLRKGPAVDATTSAAATLSVLDYLGEISWLDYPAAKDWYSRMKSRPSFRPLLADRVRGLSPVSHYADLDF